MAYIISVFVDRLCRRFSFLCRSKGFRRDMWHVDGGHPGHALRLREAVAGLRVGSV